MCIRDSPVNCPIEYVLDCIHTIYSIKHKNGAIRRVNVNIAATTVENYRKLKEAGLSLIHISAHFFFLPFCRLAQTTATLTLII